MPKIESEKIDCLYRPCSRPAPRGKIESVRTHSEVIEQFDSFSMLKLLFLVRNWHCWSRKAFPRQMTPQSREKTAKTAVFRHHWQAWKVVRSIAAVRQRPRTPRNWRCSFAFFETSFDILIKNSMQRWSSDFQGLFRLKIRKMAQGSDDLSTLPLSSFYEGLPLAEPITVWAVWTEVPHMTTVRLKWPDSIGNLNIHTSPQQLVYARNFLIIFNTKRSHRISSWIPLHGVL